MSNNEDYLNGLIAKAKKSWEGVDVESYMSDLRDDDMKTIEERAKANLAYEQDFCGNSLSDNMVCRAYVRGAEEQKAIDEAIRLKKCDDMTEAEYNREVAFLDWFYENSGGTITHSDAIEWARKETIAEACKWFTDYLMEIGYPDDWMRDSPNMESGKERFIKAMEKAMEE